MSDQAGMVISGFVAGEKVTVLGKVVGGIRGKMVALMPSARVEGDIHHNSLTIANGAELTGRCQQNEAWPGGKRNAA